MSNWHEWSQLHKMATLFKSFCRQGFICFILIAFLIIILHPFSETLKNPLCPTQQPLKSRSYYQSYLDQETAFRFRIGKKLEPFHVHAASPWKNFWGIYFWDAFIPTLTCPHFMERIGSPSGGGKWLCGFELFEGEKGRPCVLYSFGVGPDSSFEAEFLKRTNCSVHMFDHTKGAPSEGPGKRLPSGSEHRWTYERVGLGKESTNLVRTLGDTMRKYGHAWIDFLKVDIEWNEFATFDQIMKEFEVLPFGQLNLEIHLQKTAYDDAADMDEYRRFKKWWNGLIDHGLRAWTWEVNHGPTVTLRKKPFAVEYSFLNVKKNPVFLLID